MLRGTLLSHKLSRERELKLPVSSGGRACGRIVRTNRTLAAAAATILVGAIAGCQNLSPPHEIKAEVHSKRELRAALNACRDMWVGQHHRTRDKRRNAAMRWSP